MYKFSPFYTSPLKKKPPKNKQTKTINRHEPRFLLFIQSLVLKIFEVECMKLLRHFQVNTK